LTVKALESCASSVSAPEQGPANAGHALHIAKSRDNDAVLMMFTPQ
jgi:hypothetical protein